LVIEINKYKNIREKNFIYLKFNSQLKLMVKIIN